SLGIEVRDAKSPLQFPDEHHLKVTRLKDKSKGGDIRVILQDEQGNAIASWTSSRPDGFEFDIRSPFLGHSCIEFAGAIIPLRRYFQDPRSAKEAKKRKLPDKEELLIRGWEIPPAFIDPHKPSDATAAKGKDMSAADILSKAGIVLPEGTVFYHELPK